MHLGIATETVSNLDELRDAVVSDVTVEPADVATLATSHVDVVAAVGEAGVLNTLRAGVEAPILPIDAPSGLEPIDRADLAKTTAALVNDDHEIVERASLHVDLPDGRRSHGLFEAVAMTTDPAAISEYQLHADDRPVAGLRADGMVVASPTGSGGYGTAAGGPILGPTADVMAVIPVSPFLTTPPNWVIDAIPVELTVRRDETTVGVFVDDHVVGNVESGETITVSWGDPIHTVRVPESTSPYRRESA